MGLASDQVEDLTDFLENGLYDPAFARFDPNSPTRTFEPKAQDLTYSVSRPDLAALGAEDGRMPSRLPRSNNDALSRRDLGLEFLDVTRQVDIALVSSKRIGVTQQEDVYRITNTGSSPVDTHLLLIATGLSGQVQMENATGTTGARYPYLRVFVPGGALLPGQSTVQTLQFKALPHVLPTASYVLTLLSGQGNP